MRHCGVQSDATGKHSADEPDPILMAALPTTPPRQVLIFKQSAGTGFDAPRAFVLASIAGERCGLCHAVHWLRDAWRGRCAKHFPGGRFHPS